VIGKVEVLERDPLPNRGFRLGDSLGLDLAILEHRLDHEVARLECTIVGGGRDAREQRVAVGCRRAALGDLISHELGRMRLALVGRLLVAVDQHHVESGERSDVGDAGAHEACTNDSNGFERRCRNALGTARALVELLQGDEQGADHRRRFRRTQDFREPPRFDAQRQVHRQLQALVDDLQDGACRGVVVVGLAPIERIGGGERHHAGLGVDRPARQAEAFHVPGRLRLAMRLDPAFGMRDEFGGGHDRIDQFDRLGLRRANQIALEQKLQRITRRQHAGNALRAAGTGKQADLDLRQAQARLVAVGRHPVMTGQAELEAAAKRGAVDRRDPRLAAGLQPPIEQRQLAALLEQHGDRRLLAARLAHVGELAAVNLQHGEVGAGAERLLGRGHDRALDRWVARHFLHDRGKLLDDLEIDEVHRSARRVPRDRRDAIGVDVELEVDVCHVRAPYPPSISDKAHPTCGRTARRFRPCGPRGRYPDIERGRAARACRLRGRRRPARSG
jgi:hypothetical protein